MHAKHKNDPNKHSDCQFVVRLLTWPCFKRVGVLFHSRVTFYADLFQKLFGCENILHTELARVSWVVFSPPPPLLLFFNWHAA